jgi:hypothetical protein
MLAHTMAIRWSQYRKKFLALKPKAATRQALGVALFGVVLEVLQHCDKKDDRADIQQWSQGALVCACRS